jgi:hypothetical protein
MNRKAGRQVGENGGVYSVQLDGNEVAAIAGEMEALIMEGHPAAPTAERVLVKLAAAGGIAVATVEALSQLAG